MEAATLNAASVPLKAASMCKRVLELSLEAAEKGNLNAISDAASAANLAVAAMKCAALNVNINLKSLDNPESAGDIAAETNRLILEIAPAEIRLKEILHERAGL
jgi:glutamate formiminotransferase/formiminotetrahydrofolate cyclodeaminase